MTDAEHVALLARVYQHQSEIAAKVATVKAMTGVLNSYVIDTLDAMQEQLREMAAALHVDQYPHDR